jgi:hypothetical protein
VNEGCQNIYKISYDYTAKTQKHDFAQKAPDASLYDNVELWKKI